MKILKLAALIVLFYISLPGMAFSDILSQSCTEDVDPYTGEVYGISCNTSTSYQLEGTASLYNAVDGSYAFTVDLVGAMTQDSIYNEDYYGASSGEEIWTSLTVDSFTLLMNYSMDQYSGSLDWGEPLVFSMSDSVTGGYTTDGLTQWSIQADGYNALIHTLDGDGDGINGINLYLGSELSLIGDVELHTVPVPAAVWLFSSGLIGLLGFARRKKV